MVARTMAREMTTMMRNTLKLQNTFVTVALGQQILRSVT
jgi:hypothetical protein